MPDPSQGRFARRLFGVPAQAWLPLGLIAVLTIAALLIHSLADEETAFLARTEEGPVERLTVVVYGIALILCVAGAAALRWRFGVYPAILLLASMLRELDMDTRQGASGEQKLTSIRYWRSPEFPLLEKLVAGALVAGLAVALWSFLRRGLHRLLGDLRAGRAYAFSVLGIAALLAASMILDNRLDMGALDNPVVLYFSLLEECLELGIALLCCIALIQFFLDRRTRDNSAEMTRD